MKIYKFTIALMACALLAACSDDDELEAESVITIDEQDTTPFDAWLETNFVEPYNVEIKYRFAYNEENSTYYSVPADYEQSIKMAHIIKHTCVEAYEKVAGVTFVKHYFPKLFYFSGAFHYNNNGTIQMGSAEGGKKINMLGINSLNSMLGSVSDLNEYYLKTIHHEFCHILNQTLDYSASYQLITPDGYVSSDWSSDENSEGYLERGFISAYSQYAEYEDFAEMLSTYVITPKDEWEAMLVDAATYEDGSEASGREYIESKLTIVRDYMLRNFDVDIDVLRDEVVARTDEVANGEVNLTEI